MLLLVTLALPARAVSEYVPDRSISSPEKVAEPPLVDLDVSPSRLTFFTPPGLFSVSATVVATALPNWSSARTVTPKDRFRCTDDGGWAVKLSVATAALVTVW